MFGSMRADFGYPLGVIRPPASLRARCPGSPSCSAWEEPERISQNGFGILSGVTLDSRAVRPGDLYAALPGTRTHGAAYSDQAVAAGAVAILTDPDGRDRAARTGVPVFVVSSPRERLGDVSCWIYGDPSHRMTMIGVTGNERQDHHQLPVRGGAARRRAHDGPGRRGGDQDRRRSSSRRR